MDQVSEDRPLPVWLGLFGYGILFVLTAFFVIAVFTAEWDVAWFDGFIIVPVYYLLAERYVGRSR